MFGCLIFVLVRERIRHKTDIHTYIHTWLSIFTHTRPQPGRRVEWNKTKSTVSSRTRTIQSREKFFLPSNVEAASHPRRRRLHQRRTPANGSNNPSPHVKRVSTLPSASGEYARPVVCAVREDITQEDQRGNNTQERARQLIVLRRARIRRIWIPEVTC